MAVYRRGLRKYRVVLWFEGIRREWIVNGTREEADSFDARKRLELEAGTPAALLRTVPTLSAFCALHYRPHAELHLGKYTWHNQAFMVANLMTHLGDFKLTELRPEHVDGYIRERRRKPGPRVIEYERKGKTISYKLDGDAPGPVTVNNELRALKTILNFARRRGVPVASLKIQFLPEAEHRAKAWTSEQLEQLFVATREVAAELLPMVVFLANTGMRKGEALALTWDHVDLAGRQIQVWPSDVWKPKSGRPREVPISDALLPWLEVEHRSKRWVFPSRSGTRFAGWPKKQWERAVAAAGLVGGAHRLRHTYASHFLAACPDLGALAAILGHSDEATTRLYAHMLPGRLERARAAVSISPGIGPATLAAQKAWR